MRGSRSKIILKMPFKPRGLNLPIFLGKAPAAHSSLTQLTENIEISAGLCIISLLYFIFPPLSINKAEAAKAVLWMLPGGNSFSSMNTFNSHQNTARDGRKPHTETFLCPGVTWGSLRMRCDGTGWAAGSHSPALWLCT